MVDSWLDDRAAWREALDGGDMCDHLYEATIVSNEKIAHWFFPGLVSPVVPPVFALIRVEFAPLARAATPVETDPR